MHDKHNILFIHSNIGQFKALHQHLNSSGLANSWLMCSQNNFTKHASKIPNLIPFTPHGNKLKSENSFYYLKKLEEVDRRSLGILKAIKEFTKTQPIDLIVAHGTGGAPMMLFDELNIPIISYIEYPSFSAHGWDPKYPPPAEKIRRDKNFEMLSYYNVFKSARTITPSRYAKSLFPKELHDKIIPQMEGFGFAPKDIKSPEVKQDTYTIGFCARDLSSAKGIEHFLLVSKKLLELRENLHFTIIGSPKLLYSYEQHYLDKLHSPKKPKSFVDYLIERENLNLDHYTFTGSLPYEEYQKAIDEVDIFHYPVQFSSGSWGLFELLSRGKIVIGSNRCFVPEIIDAGVSGYILDYGNIESWATTTLNILDSPDSWLPIQKAALDTALSFSIDKVAPKFLKIFNEIIDQDK